MREPADPGPFEHGAAAWIYAHGDDTASEAEAVLAGLGYRTRHVLANGSLRPGNDGNGIVEPPPDLALVLLSGAEGRALCGRLRRDRELGEVPIVLRIAPEELAAGGALDADELIVGRASEAEMRARLARARRVTHGPKPDDVVRVGDLELDFTRGETRVGGEPIALTALEHDLLRFLAMHPRRVFTRDVLLSRVWGYEALEGTRTVDAHIRRVRAKLPPRHAQRITTVRSVGYRFDP